MKIFDDDSKKIINNKIYEYLYLKQNPHTVHLKTETNSVNNIYNNLINSTRTNFNVNNNFTKTYIKNTSHSITEYTIHK